MEGALRDSENRARVLLEAASEGVVVVDADGRIVMVNGRTAQMFGYEREELIGSPLERLIPPRLREPHAHHRRAFFAEPRTRPMGRGLDLAGCRKDGTEFPVEISLSYVQTEEGVQALGFISDISERLATERAARQADRLAAIGRLAAGVAHEVNNPIGIIASRIELMLLEAPDHGLPSAVVSDLEVLHRHATRIAAITQKLLSFARQSPSEHTTVDLNAVVREALLFVERDLGHDGVRIHTALAEPLPPVRGDSSALQQVILNIVTNSRQAIGERGEIAVTTLHDKDEVRIIVRDSGPGIAPDILPKIFDPFFTTKSDGTGLGLSITYGIVREHHGTVDVESRPGAGTTFTLTFPAAPTSA
jgi:PAS domain S-box-containing protein